LWVAISLGFALTIGAAVGGIALIHVTHAMEDELLVHLTATAEATSQTIKRDLELRQRVEMDLAEHPILVNAVMQSQDRALLSDTIDHMDLVRVLGEKPHFALLDFEGEQIVNPDAIELHFGREELNALLAGDRDLLSRFAIDTHGLTLQRAFPLRYGGREIEGALLLQTHPELRSLIPAWRSGDDLVVVASVDGRKVAGDEAGASEHGYLEVPGMHFFGLDITLKASLDRVAAVQREVVVQTVLALSVASLILGIVVWWIGLRALVLPHERTLELVRALDLARANAETAAQSKMRFLANMSHELRTPFNGILGNLEVLGNSTLDAEQRRLQVMATDSATSLLQIIDDILDLSRIEKGRLPIEPIEVDLAELAGSLIELLARSSESRGLKLEITGDADFPRYVHTDPLRLRQILLNLIGNAIKFTHEGAVTLSMCRQSDRLEFAVSDTGVGIEPERLDAIFEAFEQAAGGTARQFGGTGLGLGISRRLARLLNGDIAVESEVGNGSVFRLSLPLSAIRRESECAFVARPGGIELASKDEKPALSESIRPALDLQVLVAEDNPTNQILIRKQLEGCGCHVEIASDGMQAVRTGLAGEFDLILMDLQMPQMDGVTACQRLREAGCATPIVALTANVMQEDRERCGEAGMDDFLAKPFVLAELEKLLRGFDPGEAADSVDDP